MEKITTRHTTKHALRDLLYTIIICVIVAVLLTVAGTHPFILNLMMSLSFGLSVCSMVLFLIWLFKPEKVSSFVFMFATGIIGGNVIGLLIGSYILQQFFSVTLMLQEREVIQTIITAIAIGSAVAYFFYSKALLRNSQHMIQERGSIVISSEKEALEAKLRLLQAQIEPHFLFNTLSNVLSLIDTEPARGKSMLTDLTHYLRTSLSRTLPETTTLDQEIDMIQAYLNIQKIRMDERLNFTIELPDALRQHPFPPMLLQPLVENAIKHGLEPKIDGGDHHYKG